MFKFWLLNGQRWFLLHDAADADGGAGGTGADDDGGDNPDQPTGDHPAFEIPEGVGDGDGEGDDPAPKPKAAKPKAGDPARQPVVDSIPKHRLDEVIAARDEIAGRLANSEKELARFKKLIGASLGIIDPDAPGEPKPLTERDKAIQQRIFQLVPWLGKLERLAERAEVLGEVAEQMPDFSKQNQQYWGRVARQMYDAMEGEIAPLFMGKGKTAADMPVEMRARYRADFYQWVNSDEKRMDRYEQLDPTLAADYRKELDTTVVAPLRRQFGASALDRSRGIQNLPVSGGSGTPSRTPKPKPAVADEDAAADAAWKNLQERLQEA